jgi:alkanesulfonate monooxygenase SsuD/methylene tetrahydromethanopterin reductase-like flavin-dependent oxidoreductase (luciferase family)
MPKQKKYWGVVQPMPAEMLAGACQQYESIGLEGLWVPQLWGPPFTTLAASAMVTKRVKLGSGVALAFTRSPLETASAARDLDAISGGRAVLGIGTSIRWWNESWYGASYGKPIPHLREAVKVVRLLIAKGHTGELGKWEGEYYQLDFTHMKFLSPPTRTEIPIYLPAIYEAPCRVAGEIAEGLASHPIWCEPWITGPVPKAIEQGLAKAGRKRADFDYNVWLFLAPGPNKKECLDDARSTVAFYAQFDQYTKFFEATGFGDEARAIVKAGQAGDKAGMLRACPDRMVDHYSICGPIDEVRARIEKIWTVADSITPMVAFYDLPVEKLLAYNARIAEALFV